MFNLDESISRWRQEIAGGIKSRKVLDELEGHLREDIRALASDGVPEPEAFRVAVSRLGDANAVSNEFKKLNRTTSMPWKIGVAIWTGLSTALAIGLLNGVLSGKPSVLLAAHIFCLSAGYGATFLTGGFGIYYVCSRWFRVLSPDLQQSLGRAVLSFTGLSVSLVITGLLLGMFWSSRNLGGYYAGGARELGTVCASIWVVVFWLVQGFGRVSTRVTMLLCIVGNMIVSLAWFGAGIVAHGDGLGSYWLLDAWLGGHLVLFAIGVMPIFETAEA